MLLGSPEARRAPQQRERWALKKREAAPARSGGREASAAPPPAKKKSQARVMNEIAAGNARPGQRNARDGVKQAVVEEKGKEEEGAEDEEEEVEYDLGDDAIVKKIDKRAAAADKKLSKAPKKRNVGASRKKTSVVHVMFEKVDGKEGAYRCLASVLPCKTGHPNVVKQVGGGTSNLITHARTWHKDVVDGLVKASNDHKDVESEFQGMLEAAVPPSTDQRSMEHFANVVSRSKTGFETQLALLIMIVGCSLPFSIIDSKYFKDWMSVLGRSLQSEGTIKKMLAPLYDTVRLEQEAFVRKCGFFTTTFDLWTSIAKQKYLVTTYHTMDEGFSLFSAPLDLIPMSCSAFGEFIALAIEARINHHHFDSCVFMASFSDSGSNCKLAKGLLTPGDEEPCFHHMMKLMLDDVIGGADGGGTNAVAALDLLSVGLLVAIVRPNPQLRSEISRAAEKVGIESLELITANITRWEALLGAAAVIDKGSREALFRSFYCKSKGQLSRGFFEGVVLSASQRVQGFAAAVSQDFKGRAVSDRADAVVRGPLGVGDGGAAVGICGGQRRDALFEGRPAALLPEAHVGFCRNCGRRFGPRCSFAKRDQGRSSGPPPLARGAESPFGEGAECCAGCNYRRYCPALSERGLAQGHRIGDGGRI
jgi:hypothetical protein